MAPERHGDCIEEREIEFNAASPSSRMLSPVPPRDVAPGSVRHRTITTPASLDDDGTRKRKKDLDELRMSHIGLSVQVAQLAAELRSTMRLAQDTHGLVRGPCSISDRSLHRAMLFANIAVVQALESSHPELSKTYSALCPANCVRQITLRSKRSDCTLFDIRLMISHFMRQVPLRTTISPSALLTMKSSTRHQSIIEVAFPTFADLCDSLMISGEHREAGVYRERAINYRSSRVLRRVQVLGVATTRSESLDDGESETKRKLLLARSMPTERDAPEQEVHVLLQQSTTWSDNTWDDKFVYKEEDIAQVRDFAMTTLMDEEPSSSSRRNKKPRKSKVEQAFVLRWERCTISPHPSDADPHLIPGALRLYFTAVVVRSVILVESTQAIFNSELNGRTLQDILCTSSKADCINRNTS